MIPLRARLIAGRHQEIVGRPVKSWRVGAGPLLPAVLLAVLVLVGILLVLVPGDHLALTVGLMVVLALILLGAYLVTVDARLVVCERGLIMGRMVPGLPLSPTYVIAGREIDPRTICVVADGAKAAQELGMPFFFFQYKTFPGALGVPALVFNGPWGADVSAPRRSGPLPPRDKSLFIFSQRRAADIADQMLRMIGREGAIPPGFAPHGGLQPIPVTGRRQDAVSQIPGAWAPEAGGR
ncbi:hypothetical protein [Brachybacterium sp. ACRRE]|uniref:hypothetical protein n=1 Tax=Brachybacterium sp. ACRRE TaxID=2918184 RepID=UPI001EF2DC64|nr:hypothetical protein [Brachybacterium sp. ACRRE]MCG7308840.1 hypothetical protein [Brachybacterium sp. ACRRE]